MSIVNQIMNNIKEDLKYLEVSQSDRGIVSARIIAHLTDLRIKEEYQSVSDFEFYDIVGETFKLNPEFFMNHIYPKMRGRKLYKKINKMEMEKYIIEKFCLYEGEQLLYECNSKIKETNPGLYPWRFVSTRVKASVDGRIYVTNYRIIANGKLRERGKIGMIEGSTHQELPCYGFQFKITNHVRLKKKSNGIVYIVLAYKVLIELVKSYKINISNLSRTNQINALLLAMRKVRLTLPSSKKEDINNLFGALCKNVYQTINSFIELHELGLVKEIKQIEFLYRLRKLWDSEEYQHLSNSEYLEIVEAVYNLDPQFFMTMVYPKMMSWTFPSFLNVKSEISEILNKDA
ncbi:MAG: hypothetical protein ACFE94_05785 [Candidatus Hodarchaeota archaeon]